LFKFIHTADVHLDSPLIGLSKYQDAPVDLLRNATRSAFSQLINMALEEKVAFVIIAGDLYDGTWKDFKTGFFFISEMNRLRNKGIRCLLLYGNHDAESQITKNLTLPDNVFVFPNRNASTFNLKDIGVSAHGRSFKERDTYDNLADSYPDPVPGDFNIGVLHTGLEGDAAHAHYAPCTLDQLKTKGYDYWALGHIHQKKILNKNPHIIFPGNLQGRKINEQGPKGAVLVTVEDNSIVDMEWVYPDVVRWRQIEIDLTECEKLEEALLLSQEAMHKVVGEDAEGRTLAIRIIFNVRLGFFSSIAFDEIYFREELQAIGMGDYGDELWIEKIKFKVPRVVASKIPENHGDAVYELKELLGEAVEDEVLIKNIVENMAKLLRSLPPEIRSDNDLELISCLQSDQPKKLVEEVIPFLLSSLLKQENK
jgi:DNA repair protein SbcD/Mre11